MAQELILSGFFPKSSLKGAEGYSEMFMNSLDIYMPKTVSEEEPKVRECKHYFENSNFDTYDVVEGLEKRNTLLPVRCTSTMDSDSSSGSEANDADDKSISDLQGEYIDSATLDLKKSIKPFQLKPPNNDVIYCDIDHKQSDALYRLNKRLVKDNK